MTLTISAHQMPRRHEHRTDPAAPPAGQPASTFHSLDEFLRERLPDLMATRCLVTEVVLPSSVIQQLSQQASNDVTLVLAQRTPQSPAAHAPAVMATPSGRVNTRLHELADTLRREISRLQPNCSPAMVTQALGNLSARECDVLLRLVCGDTCKRIAADLQVGLPTVARHKCHLLQKFQVNSVAELMTVIWNCLLAEGQATPAR